jgi:transposase
VSTVSAACRHDLSDALWVVMEPLLPASSRRGRPRRDRLRDLVDGVRHRTRVGCPWRDVPRRYGPWWDQPDWAPHLGLLSRIIRG